MCGPLVMALPISQMNPIQKVLATILYHIGKITTYGLLGVVVGVFGKQIPFYNVQQHLSIVIGSLMLVYVLWVFYLHPKRKLGFLKIDWLQKPIIAALGKLFKQNNVGSFLLIGFLNGLLPCGMIYLALGSAWANQSALQSGLFMVLFGLGTLPALLMVAFGGQLMGFAFRQKIQKALPYMLFSMGVLLILRGMNLGIPYISPMIDNGASVAACHN
ncbi:MAG: sulfite exporter TauE/SafE family protein [Sediminibacterium sp.]|nr:sulfite exporter TauE/SafE family protein [Sediminibacterium sp.]